MTAAGTFDVDLTPQDDGTFPAGRMLIKKKYAGDLTGDGIGQMISKRTESETAAYFAVEEVSGALDGKQGSFTLLHRGLMNADGLTLEVVILEGSGRGDLESISGTMTISQDEGGHQYTLTYEV